MKASTRWAFRFALVAMCGLSSTPLLADPPTRAHLVMRSDPGDFIGLGRHFNLRQPPWMVEVWVTPWDQSVTIDFFPPDWPANTGKWYLRFSMPGGGPIQEGLYENVSRWVSAPSPDARMWIAGEHRGCNRIGGWFWVRRAETDAFGWPTYLDIVFQQHCELKEPALSGRIRLGQPRRGTGRR